MAYNIVKHRRGTTQEWFEADLIPEDGELVIEECSDGSRRCKLGNGHTKFLYLPYIDEAIQTELLEEIDKAVANLESKLETNEKALSRQIEKVGQTLDGSLIKQVNILSEDYISRDSKLSADLNKSIKTGLAGLQKDLKAELSSVKDTIDSNIALVKTELETDINKATDRLNLDFNDALNEAIAISNETITTLDHKLTKNLDTEISTRESRDKTLVADIGELRLNIKNTAKELTDAKDAAIEALDKKLSETILTEASKREAQDKTLADDITNFEINLQQTTNALNSRIDVVANNISTTNKNVVENLSAEITERKEQAAYLAQDISKLTADLQNSFTSVSSTVDAAIKDLASTDKKLDTKLSSEISTRENQNKILNQEIAKLETDLENVTGGLVSTINNSVEKLSATDRKLETQIHTEAEKYSNQINTLSNTVDKLEEDLNEALNILSSDTQTQIAALESDNEKIADNLATEREQREEQANAIMQSISELDAAIEDRISPAINTLDKKVSNSIKSVSDKHSADIIKVQASLEDTLTSFDEKLLSQSDELSSRLDDTVTALNANITSTVNELSSTLYQAVANLETDFDNQIRANTEAMQTAVSTAEIRQINRLNSAEETFNTKISEVSDELQESLVQVKEELSVADTKLAGDIVQLELYSQQVTNNISKQLDNLVEKTANLDTVDGSLLTKIYATNNRVSDLTTELSNGLEAIKQYHINDYSYITNELTRLTDTNNLADLHVINMLLAYAADVYTELAVLVEDDIAILKKVFKVENSLKDTLKELDEQLKAKIDGLENNLSTGTGTIEQILIERITALEEALTESILETKNTLNADIETFKISSNLKIDSNTTAINNLEAALQDKHNEVLAKFDDVENAAQQITADLDSTVEDFESQVSSVNTRIDDINNRLENEFKRLSNIISLSQGSTTGDAELMDIRNGYNGLSHDCAGDAVRAIGYDLASLRDSLSQYIDSEAINGLYYDYNGEVGLNQPYMLYLTANNEVISESGVQIISGAGGAGASTASSLKLGYVTESPVVVTVNDKTIVKYTFSGTDSSGDTIKQAAASWKVNGTTVAYETIKDGENEFDLTKYIKPGTTKVLLTVTDDNGSVVTKTWSVQQIDLSIASSFDDKSIYTAGEEIIFSYVPTGAIDKTAVFKLDGKEIVRKDLPASISGIEVKQVLSAQAHGAHLLEVSLEAMIGDKPLYAESIQKDIIWYDNTNTTPIIGTTTKYFETVQYATTNIVYTVYDPANETPIVSIEVDGKVVSTPSIRINPDYNNTPTAIYSFMADKVGTHTIKITCGQTEKVITTYVEELDINVAPVTTGLVFDFNPTGRTNGDSQRLWSSGDINMIVSSNFDWTNGGYIPDDPDGPCFCIKAGSTATINYKLFADDAKKQGKEFKLIFKTKHVSNPDAIFLSCLDNTTDTDHIGLQMSVQGAKIYGKSGNLDLVYSEEDVIEFEFNISKDTELVPMVMGYEDGVPSRPLVYDDSFDFKQSDAKEIVLGSPDCDLFIYRLKVYSTSLTAPEILSNFIADARTSDEMISRYNRNQIYDENSRLTPEVLAEKCPWLRVYKLSAPHFTNNKSDKVSGTTIQQLYKNGDPVLDNWTCYNAQHSGQGTSSNNYGAAGRNLDFIMNKSSSYFELGDGTEAHEITLTRTSVPVAYLNAKVNIASSNNLTNAILANHYNKFNPYRRPFVRPEGYPIENIKDTMEFHNCVIFIQETDPDLSTHREFADTEWHFYAIGNIGDSKKTDKTRLTDPSDKYECCVEIMDVKLPLSDFPRDTMYNAMGYTTDETTEERIYTWAKDSNLNILYEKQADGSYVLTSDTTVDLTKTYYVDILEHDDFSEDYTYGWRYISDDEDSEVVNTCKQAWIDFYRFVTTSTDEEFKANLKNYFVIDSALYYYLFTTRYCMVDNRAKNTFWHYGKTADGTRKWDLCWDYDNDTSLGLNNYGKQVYRYGLEDIDVDASGEEIFREMDSTFFCRVRDLFAAELKKMYKDLESQNAWHAESFIKTCDNWQEEFPEELWRLDIDRKYIRTYTTSFINGKGDNQFLVNMCNGRMKYHRRQWERNQEQYMSSKYQTTRASGDDYHANFRFGGPNTENPAILANYQLTLIPYSYMYLNVQYGSTTPSTVRITDENINTPVTVPFFGDSADIVNVYNASAIRDFGDLSACYPKTVSIGNASRVKSLTLGNDTEGYDNTVFTTLTTDANPLLEELDLTNISSLTQSLNFSKLINLRVLKAFGTSAPSVLFADGGKLSYVELPAVNELKFKNLIYLSSENIRVSSYDNVVDLVVEGCPLINKVDLFNKCTKLRKVRLVDVDFGEVTYEYFVNKLFKLKGIASNGDELENAYLVGTCYIDSLTGSEYTAIHSRYPNLEINFRELTSTITFRYKDTSGEEQVHTVTVVSQNSELGQCDEPILETNPAWPENDAFTYVFKGWSSTEQVSKGVEDKETDYEEFLKVNDLNDIANDLTLYPVFEAVRKSYPVTFINPTDSNKVLQTIMVPYGSDAKYTGAIPERLDVESSDLYEFVSWYPDTKNITGTLTCYAQFSVKDDKWYTLTVSDLATNGYTLNTSNKTLAVTECVNKFNAAVRVPNSFNIAGIDYTIKGIGGFSSYEKLELITLPSAIEEIKARGFYNCQNLFELTLPNDLQIIGAGAFQGCSKIKTIYIPEKVNSIGDAAFSDCENLIEITIDENNTRFALIDGCLIDTSSHRLLQGLSNGNIPQDGSITSLGSFCFSNTDITTVSIPENIEIIPENAFRRCYNLKEVTLPSTIKELHATCFAWCHELTTVNLPEGLRTINTYIFNECALTEVTIPSSVDSILARAFGAISTLKTVTFEEKLDKYGNIVPPTINEAAFVNSGSTDHVLTFNVPWSKDKTPEAPWGAKNCMVNYEYGKEVEYYV